MVLAGEAIYSDTILSLYDRIVAKDFSEGQGSYSTLDIKAAYIERIISDVKLARPIKIAVDCGNGVAGALPAIYTVPWVAK